MAISTTTSSPAHAPTPRQSPYHPPPPLTSIPIDIHDSALSMPATLAPLNLKPASPSKPAPSGPTRRELLAKGKEGSRRRQRWENDHFVSNPHFVPPTKADFSPAPLYPKRTVPYHYASLWEHPSFPRRQRSAQSPGTTARVPRELKSRLKRSHGALALLETLEREVREFLFSESFTNSDSDDGEGEGEYESSVGEATDSEEDEIVFVSRRERLGVVSEKAVFQCREEEQGASFRRWLVHSIAGYYGIQSWSVTEGNPAVRYAYVAKPPRVAMAENVPKPLYLIV